MSFPFPFIPPSVSGSSAIFVTSASSTENTSTRTFAATNIGTARASRLVIVAIVANKATSSWSANPISGVTIGGVTATIAGSQPINNGTVAAVYYATVPTGATGDIVITTAAASNGWFIGVYDATVTSATPTDSDNTNGHVIGSLSLTALTVPSGGFGIAVVGTAQTGVTSTWTGFSENYDNSLAAGTGSGAYSATPGTPTITATFSNPSTGQIAMAGAAWA